MKIEDEAWRIVRKAERDLDLLRQSEMQTANKEDLAKRKAAPKAPLRRARGEVELYVPKSVREKVR
jgi:hypothetical protein